MARRPESQEESQITDDLRDAVRREAISQTAKWVVVGTGALLVTAFVGWGLYLKPLITNILGGLPIGAVVAFDTTQGCPADGSWKRFDLAAGRTVVGASLSGDPALGNDDAGEPIGPKSPLSQHGMQSTVLQPANLPPFNVTIKYNVTNNLGDKPYPLTRGLGAVGSNASYDAPTGGSSQAFSNEMPYVALLYCEKIK